MLEVLLVLIGVVIGLIGALMCLAGSSVGTLRIDHSDPTEAPYLFLELDKPVDAIANKKRVMFRVNKKNYISK